MKSFFGLLIICLAVGVRAAQVPSPVYRSAPTVLKAQPQVQPQARNDLPQPQSAAPSSQQPQPGLAHHAGQPRAEERESQLFASSGDQAAAKVGGANPVGVRDVQQGVATPGQQAVNPVNPAEFQLIYVPQREPIPQSGYVPTYNQYQGQTSYQSPGVAGVGLPGAGAVAPVSEGFWNNINWKDTGVALACIALVGAGGAMLYPKLAHFKARAMRELAELDAEDAKRVARNVFTAIKKFSDLNRN